MSQPSQHTLRDELAALWRIAWPLLVAQTAQMGTGVVDTMMAGRYNDQDLAAIAIGFNIWLPLYLLILGTLFATAAIVAQDFGAGARDRIRSQLPQALWVAMLLSLVLAPVCYHSEPVLALLGLEHGAAISRPGHRGDHTLRCGGCRRVYRQYSAQCRFHLRAIWLA